MEFKSGSNPPKFEGGNLVEKLYYVIPTKGGYRNSWNYYIDDDSKGEKLKSFPGSERRAE